jgi:hypothetical protein
MLDGVVLEWWSVGSTSRWAALVYGGSPGSTARYGAHMHGLDVLLIAEGDLANPGQPDQAAQTTFDGVIHRAGLPGMAGEARRSPGGDF